MKDLSWCIASWYHCGDGSVPELILTEWVVLELFHWLLRVSVVGNRGRNRETRNSGMSLHKCIEY